MISDMLVVRDNTKTSLCDLEESAAHPLPLPEGAPQVMMFDALSYGIHAASPTCREPLATRHVFVKIMKNEEK